MNKKNKRLNESHLISPEEFNKLSSEIEINSIPLPHNLNYDDENRDSFDETLMGMEYALDEFDLENELDNLDEEEISDEYSLEVDDDLTKPQVNSAPYTHSF